jgi:hypothetical protein
LKDLGEIVSPPKNEISEKPIASKGSENVKIAMKDIDEIVPPSKNEISEKPIASDGSQNVKIAIKDIDEIVPPPKNEISEKTIASDGSQNALSTRLKFCVSDIFIWYYSCFRSTCFLWNIIWRKWWWRHQRRGRNSLIQIF